MIVLQLLVALAVLPTSDGAQSQGIMKCAFNQWQKLCEHIIVAYNDNEDAVRDLRERKYRDDKGRLQKTNRNIIQLLKMKAENKSELLAPLQGVLEQEVSAVFQLGASCNAMNKMDRRLVTIYCEDALYFSTLATHELVLAIMEVADVSQVEEIKKAEEKFEEQFYNETSDKTPYELGHTLGTEVRSILEREQQS